MKQVLIALALGLALAACGKGELGEACDKPSGDGECVDGLVCTNESGGGNVCRKLCTDMADCPTNFQCNGVSGGSLHSCQPK